MCSCLGHDFLVKMTFTRQQLYGSTGLREKALLLMSTLICLAVGMQTCPFTRTICDLDVAGSTLASLQLQCYRCVHLSK
ncbi:hypothetical protein DPEC_G00335960 [Dallia pectoralis]|uniref:Uncharacterized protein n=1 Tax=Dallia pectoralis TaxID=75939 RepID=A0ACC2F736_DALPE|nr:hypothetical protein DPEC_G00335960 [Dallia pectoralis]